MQVHYLYWSIFTTSQEVTSSSLLFYKYMSLVMVKVTHDTDFNKNLITQN